MNAPRSTDSRTEPRNAPSRPLVLLAGNPNAGKTTLFNALSGSRARVGNYPGVTVDRRSSSTRMGELEIELVDLPGTYSLVSRSPEEEVAIDAVMGRHQRRPDAIVVVVDATALSRNLYLALQLIEARVPAVIALNMMDEAATMGVEVDAGALGEALGVEVIPTVASKGEGLDALREAVVRAVAPNDASEGTGSRQQPKQTDPIASVYAELSPETLADVEEAGALVPWAENESERRFWGTWALLSLGDDQLEGIPDALRGGVRAIRERAAEADRELDLELISSRYRFIDEAVEKTTNQPDTPRRPWTDRLDSLLTHPIAGLMIFALVMTGLFEMLFSWSEPLIDGLDALIALLQGIVQRTVPEGPFQALLSDGVIQGVGNVVVFVPQLALLFLLISALEDSGYLARVAFVIDRLMSAVGLHGKAFVPLLSGFACAVPAVMATRTIENRKDRLVTMLALPLMSCSARLPVYVLVVATVFAGADRVFGVFSVGAVVLLSMYALSVVATLAAASVMRRTVLRGERPPFMLELPPYRWPLLGNLLSTTWHRVRTFLTDAGTIILALSILLWAMLSFPQSAEITAEHDVERAAATSTLSGEGLEQRLATIDASEAAAQRRQSIAGQIGHLMEPAIEPLGFDWRIGVGILAAFGAREAFVSTMGIVFGVGESDEESEPLRATLRNAKKEDGTPLLPPLAGVSLMVFFVLACQCMSTVAVVKRESGSWKWPLFLIAYMSVLAYIAALLVYQVGSWLGWGLG